jgi:cytidine deaminase
MMMTEIKKLVKHAMAAKKQAYAPYSKFRVGAALLATSGRIYTGCNIESSSYGLTICAERTAIFKAISEGERNFKAITVVSDDTDFTPPCGACRQVLLDLAGNIDFVMANPQGRIKRMKMKDFLPHAFSQKNLFRTRKK